MQRNTIDANLVVHVYQVARARAVLHTKNQLKTLLVQEWRCL